jgi:hypothetical protein
VVYLVIMFVVAALGITRLWIQQRRERAHLETVDGFRESLESIQPVFGPAPRAQRRSRSQRPRPAAATPAPATPAPTAPAPPVRHAARPMRSSIPRYKPLDPDRRAAAKRRLEARRKARARASL